MRYRHRKEIQNVNNGTEYTISSAKYHLMDRINSMIPQFILWFKEQIFPEAVGNLCKSREVFHGAWGLSHRTCRRERDFVPQYVSNPSTFDGGFGAVP